MENMENMENINPLPNLVPLPNNKDLSHLENLGLCFLNRGPHQGTADIYTDFTYPDTWKFISIESSRPDISLWKLIDQDNYIHGSVSGAWKGTYDNDLHWSVFNENLQKYTSPDKESDNKE